MNTTKTATVAVFFILITGLSMAAPFNFGISPTKVDKGTVKPGSNFYIEFYAISDSSQDISFDISRTRR